MHFNAIMDYYFYKECIYRDWFYYPIRVPGGGGCVPYLADAVWYNFKTGETICIQYKYRFVENPYTYGILNRFCYNYSFTTDIINIGFKYNSTYIDQYKMMMEIRKSKPS